MLEADGSRMFNAAVLVGPGGVVGSYRKIHLPYLGIDRFVDYGDRPFEVHAAGPVRLGINICYDASFPEGVRALALAGADLVVLPTAWPPAGQPVARFVVPARALENGIYFAAVNRVGQERGFTFIGQSRICDPVGTALAAAGEDEETILYAEIDPAVAREKHLIRVPGKHEIDRLADRRPAMYGRLVEPHELRPPGR
jgi:predicted amidohydrolase